MSPNRELPLDVAAAQSTVGLNGEVSQVPVDLVHGTLHPRTVSLYYAGSKRDVTASTVLLVIPVRPPWARKRRLPPTPPYYAPTRQRWCRFWVTLDNKGLLITR